MAEALQRDRNLTPSAGVGIRVARVEPDVANSGNDAVFAYQVATGVSLAMADSMDLLLGDRFVDTRDAELRANAGSNFDLKYDCHNVETGMRFSF